MRKDLTVSAGVRQEFQTHIGGLHLAPRGGIAWSPFKSGKTTVRAGGGIFFDWLDAQTYEQGVQLDGTHQRDRDDRAAGLPRRGARRNRASILPAGRVQFAPISNSRRLSKRSRAWSRCCRARCASTRCTCGGAARTCCAASTSTRRSNGVRPDPTAGHRHRDPVGRAIAAGCDQRQRQLHAAAAAAVPRRELHARPFARRGRRRVQPAGGQLRSRRPSAGPRSATRTHRFMSIANLPLKGRFRLGTSLRVQSALPYNITTGRDDNGDTVSNDRPAGVARNSGRGRRAGGSRAATQLGHRRSAARRHRRLGRRFASCAATTPIRLAGMPGGLDGQKRYSRGALRAGVQRAEPHEPAELQRRAGVAVLRAGDVGGARRGESRSGRGFRSDSTTGTHLNAEVAEVAEKSLGNISYLCGLCGLCVQEPTGVPRSCVKRYCGRGRHVQRIDIAADRDANAVIGRALDRRRQTRRPRSRPATRSSAGAAAR